MDGAASSATVEYGAKPAFGSVPAKEEHTFAGWAESDGGEPVAEEALPELTQNVTYYAVFTPEGSSGTGDPVEPTAPTEPTEPSAPTQPTEPTEPSQPTDPSEPAAPTEPADPIEPDDEPEQLGFFARIWRAVVDFFKRLFGLE